MFSIARQQTTLQVLRSVRCLSTAIPSSSVASTSTSDASTSSPPTPTSETTALSAKPKKLPYFVPRNSRGNLPVYSDFKNQKVRQFVHIRNVEGNIHALAVELRESLFPADSLEASKMKIKESHSRHVTIQGGRWKQHVWDWLKAKGF